MGSEKQTSTLGVNAGSPFKANNDIKKALASDPTLKEKKTELTQVQAELKTVRQEKTLLQGEVESLDGQKKNQDAEIAKLKSQSQDNREKITKTLSEIEAMVGILQQASVPSSPLPIGSLAGTTENLGVPPAPPLPPDMGMGAPPPPPPAPPPPAPPLATAAPVKPVTKVGKKEAPKPVAGKAALDLGAMSGIQLKKAVSDADKENTPTAVPLTVEETLSQEIASTQKKIDQERKNLDSDRSILMKLKERWDTLRQEIHDNDSTLDSLRGLIAKQEDLLKLLRERKEAVQAEVDEFEQKKMEKAAALAVNEVGTEEMPAVSADGPPAPPPPPPPPPGVPPAPPLPLMNGVAAPVASRRTPAKPADEVEAVQKKVADKPALDTEGILKATEERARKRLEQEVESILWDDKSPYQQELVEVLTKAELSIPAAKQSGYLASIPEDAKGKVLKTYQRLVKLAESKEEAERLKAVKAKEALDAAKVEREKSAKSEKVRSLIGVLGGEQAVVDHALPAPVKRDVDSFAREEKTIREKLGLLTKEKAAELRESALANLETVSPDNSAKKAAATDDTAQRPEEVVSDIRVDEPVIDKVRPVSVKVDQPVLKEEAPAPVEHVIPGEIHHLSQRLSQQTVALAELEKSKPRPVSEHRKSLTFNAGHSESKPVVPEPAKLTAGQRTALEDLSKYLQDKYIPERRSKMNKLRKIFGGVDREKKVLTADNLIKDIKAQLTNEQPDEINRVLKSALFMDFHQNGESIYGAKQGNLSTNILKALDQLEPGFSNSDDNPWKNVKKAGPVTPT